MTITRSMIEASDYLIADGKVYEITKNSFDGETYLVERGSIDDFGEIVDQ